MDKSIKQIADELGISKQTVSRYIKRNCIKPVSETASTYTFDEAAQTLIFTAFSQNEPYHEPLHEPLHDTVSDTVGDTVIEALLKQLDMKDQQIQEKDKQLAAKDKEIESLHEIIKQTQMLEAARLQKALPDKTNRHWWNRKKGAAE